MLWVLIFGAILTWAPPAAKTHRTNIIRVHSQINPKPCWVNGLEGTCMFVYECIKSEGRHLGMCVDNFMFGSCCSHNDSINQISEENFSNQPNVLYSPNSIQSSLRPPGSALSAKPQIISKVRPSKPTVFITKGTKRPPTTTTLDISTLTTTSRPNSSRPRPSSHLKPWTQRPPAFVTSVLSSTPNISSSPSSTSSSLSSFTSVYDLIATSKPVHRPNVTLPISSTTTSLISLETAESNAAASWSTSKPGWTNLNSANELFTQGTNNKPEILTSGKPNVYVNRPSWQSSTEIFITRPRPSSNLSQRPRPTRKPVTEESSTPISSSSSSSSSTSTTVSTTTTTTTTTTSTTVTPTTTSAVSPTVSLISTFSSSSLSSTLIPELSDYHYSGQCGVATLMPRPEMRIVGGKNAPFGGWPWQVSVRRTSFFGFSSTHRCGGALINENWIATAGHCVDDLLTSQIRIRVGEYDFSSVQEPLPFVERAAAKKIVHPKYNFYTYEYDLALVKLESPLEFQPHISPICLPASDDLLVGENATVTGWGRLSEGGTLPSILQQVTVPIVSNDKCKSMFLRAGRHEFIPDIFLCAGYESGGQDSCQGDSGGPLQVKGKDGRYFLAGIISWGIGCAEANLPGVCTRISKFVPWILENVT